MKTKEQLIKEAYETYWLHKKEALNKALKIQDKYWEIFLKSFKKIMEKSK